MHELASGAYGSKPQADLAYSNNAFSVPVDDS